MWWTIKELYYNWSKICETWLCFIASGGQTFLLAGLFSTDIALRAAKKISVFFSCFAKNTIINSDFIHNYVQKFTLVSFKFCYRGRKKVFGGQQFGHVCFIAWTSSSIGLHIRKILSNIISFVCGCVRGHPISLKGDKFISHYLSFRKYFSDHVNILLNSSEINVKK